MRNSSLAVNLASLARLIITQNPQFMLVTLFGVSTLIYYFGELVHFSGWTAMHWQFFHGVHDIQRLFFFTPIIYAYCFFKGRVMMSVTTASLIVFLPRAIFISPFPDAILRSLLFATFAIVLCSIIRMKCHKLQQSSDVKAVTGNQSPGNLGISNRIEDGVFVAEDLQIDLTKRLIKHDGQIVKLTPTEYELFSCLVRNNGKVMSHEELVSNVWGPQYSRESEYLHTFIWQIRKKIEHDSSNPKFIVNERGVGYRFVEPA
ncbi:winged helix-turn-helix domain-containing protein [Chloroflexota bacterium]